MPSIDDKASDWSEATINVRQIDHNTNTELLPVRLKVMALRNLIAVHPSEGAKYPSMWSVTLIPSGLVVVRFKDSDNAILAAEALVVDPDCVKAISYRMHWQVLDALKQHARWVEPWIRHMAAVKGWADPEVFKQAVKEGVL